MENVINEDKEKENKEKGKKGGGKAGEQMVVGCRQGRINDLIRWPWACKEN